MVNCINLIIEMSPRFILGRENVPCVAEVVNRSLKADCTDFSYKRYCILVIYIEVCAFRYVFVAYIALSDFECSDQSSSFREEKFK